MAYVLFSLSYLKLPMALSLYLDTFYRPKSLCAFYFHSASHAHPSQEGLWWTEDSCGGVNIITRVAKNVKRATVVSKSMSESQVTYVKCDLQSRARFIFIFWNHFVWLIIEGGYNRINAVLSKESSITGVGE